MSLDSEVMSTVKAPGIWLPDLTGKLLIQPLGEQSVALRAFGGAIPAPAQTHTYSVPVVATDPLVQWTGEGEEIDTSEMALEEATTAFYKLAGLVPLSRELTTDSTPAVTAQIGRGLARSLAVALDAAVFGSRGENTKAPLGLADVTGVTATPGDYKTLDAFTEAQISAGAVGATVTSWVCNADTAQKLATVKAAEGSAQSLLQPDPTDAAHLIVGGVPLLISEGVADDTVWGIPSQGQVQLIIREDAEIQVDASVLFTSDQLLVRGIARFGTVYPHAAAIQKILLSDEG